jgi:hypothetical protein
VSWNVGCDARLLVCERSERGGRPAAGLESVRDEMRRRTNGRSASAFIDGECLVLAAVARIRVERTCLRVLIAGRFGEMLSLNRLSLCGRMSLPRQSGAFLSFSLSALGLGGLLISRGARTFGLDRTASGLLAKLARLLTTTFVTPAARRAREERDEQ